MDETTVAIFIMSFISVAFIYAILAATTKIFYKNKPITELSLVQLKILNGEATVGIRISTFLMNFISSIVAPPIYILAGIITLIFWFFTS